MGLFKYYIYQGIDSIKRNVVIIIILALSISLIPALSFMGNSFLSYMLKNSFLENDTQDIVTAQDASRNIDFDFVEVESLILDTVKNSSIKYDKPISYMTFTMDSAYIYSNNTISSSYSDNPLIPMSENDARASPNFCFFNEQYYESINFQNKVKIIQGYYPQKETEIMIPYTWAMKFNFTLGENFNASLRVGSLYSGYYATEWNNISEDCYIDFFLWNYTICGLYLQTDRNYMINRHYYYSDYSYQDYVDGISYDVDKYNYYYNFDNQLIFSYMNFSLSSWMDEGLNSENLMVKNIPIFQICDKIDIHPLLSNASSLYYYPLGEPENEDKYYNPQLHINYGFLLYYDLSSFSLNLLSKQLNQLQLEINEITKSLDEHDLNFRSTSESFISETLMMNYAFKIMIYIVDIPIIIFVISLGLLAARVIRKNRLNDFLLLRIKGLPKKKLLKQIRTEAMITGVCASILSFFIGIVLFFVLKRDFMDILSLLFETESIVPSQLKLTVLWIDFLPLPIFGIIGGLITYIPIFYYIRKYTLSQLLEVREARDLPVVYDEVSVYEKNVDQVSLDWDNFLQLNSPIEIDKENSPIEDNYTKTDIDNGNENKVHPEIGIKRSKKEKKKHALFSRKRNKKKKNIYEDHIKKFEKKIPKIGIIFIILGLIPFLFLYIIFNIRTGIISEYLYMFLYYYGNISSILIILGLLCPIFVIFGLVRIIAIEKPSRFAKITRFLTKPIIHDFDKILGLKMISNKELIKWIRVFAIFITILTSINAISKSFYRYNVIAANSYIGSDINIVGGVKYNNENQNIFPEDLKLELKNDLASLQSENQSYVKNLAIVEELNTIEIEVSNEFYGFYKNEMKGYRMNISNYLQSITEDGKVLIDKDIVQSLKDLEKFNSNDPEIPGILLSKSLYDSDSYSYKIDEKIGLNISYYNSEKNQIEMKMQEFQIVGYILFPPGIQDLSNYWYSTGRFAIFDDSDQYFNNKPLVVQNMRIFADIDLKICSNITIIESNITDLLQNKFASVSITFYNQNWNIEYFDGIELYKILQIFEKIMYFLAFVLALTLGLLLTAIKKGDERFYSLLFTRGYGNKGTYKLLFAQMCVLFISGIVLGSIGGFFAPIIFLDILKNDIFRFILYRYDHNYRLQLPIYWDGFKIIFIVGGILIIAMLIYFLTIYIKKQNINKELQRF